MKTWYIFYKPACVKLYSVVCKDPSRTKAYRVYLKPLFFR